jgi:hypothetical protein
MMGRNGRPPNEHIGEIAAVAPQERQCEFRSFYPARTFVKPLPRQYATTLAAIDRATAVKKVQLNFGIFFLKSEDIFPFSSFGKQRFAENLRFHKRIAWQSLAKLQKKNGKIKFFLVFKKNLTLFCTFSLVKLHKLGIYAIYPMNFTGCTVFVRLFKPLFETTSANGQFRVSQGVCPQKVLLVYGMLFPARTFVSPRPTRSCRHVMRSRGDVHRRQ